MLVGVSILLHLLDSSDLINSHRYQGTQGSLFYNTATVQYAAAYLLQSSPTQLCPYYNNTAYTDPVGNVWQIFCGFNVADGPAVVSTTSAMGEQTDVDPHNTKILTQPS